LKGPFFFPHSRALQGGHQTIWLETLLCAEDIPLSEHRAALKSDANRASSRRPFPTPRLRFRDVDTSTSPPLRGGGSSLHLIDAGYAPPRWYILAAFSDLAASCPRNAVGILIIRRFPHSPGNGFSLPAGARFFRARPPAQTQFLRPRPTVFRERESCCAWVPSPPPLQDSLWMTWRGPAQTPFPLGKAFPFFVRCTSLGLTFRC